MSLTLVRLWLWHLLLRGLYLSVSNCDYGTYYYLGSTCLCQTVTMALITKGALPVSVTFSGQTVTMATTWALPVCVRPWLWHLLLRGLYLSVSLTLVKLWLWHILLRGLYLSQTGRAPLVVSAIVSVSDCDYGTYYLWGYTCLCQTVIVALTT